MSRPNLDHTGRQALFIDLASWLSDDAGPLTPARLEARLSAIVEAAGACDHTIVIATRPAVIRHGATLAKLGLRWRICDRSARGGARAVQETAAHLVSRGYGSVVLAATERVVAMIGPVAPATSIVRPRPIARTSARACLVVAA